MPRHENKTLIETNFLKKDGSVAITQNWNMDGANTLFIDKTNGRVGVGTNTPTRSFHISGSGSSEMLFESTTSPSWPKIRFRNPDDEWVMKINGTTGYFQLQNQISENTILALYRGTFKAVDTRVGINKSTADVTLDVNGWVGVLLDNSGLVLGAGQDAKIYYDGIDLIIDPDVVGTGVIHIAQSATALGTSLAALGNVPSGAPTAQTEWLKIKVNGQIRYIPLGG